MKPIIPTPCSEDWNKMKIGQIGRHCGVCDKSVVDFTQKSRHEILSYLIENRHQEVCGHVRLSQLDFRKEDTLIVIRDLEAKHKNSNLSYYLLSMATLVLLSCESDNSLPPQKSSTELRDTIQTSPQVQTQRVDSISDKKCNIQKSKSTDFNELHFVEGTVDGGMVIEAPIYGGTMEIVPPAPEIPTLGEIEMEVRPRFIAEIMPEFPGGTDALIEYIQRELHYPKWEKRHNIQGTVYATFVVNEKGEVTEPKILKSVEGSKNMDQEVLDLLAKMPHWKPGEDHGQKIPVQFNLPFKFVR